MSNVIHHGRRRLRILNPDGTPSSQPDMRVMVLRDDGTQGSTRTPIAPSNTTPLENGTANRGMEETYARGDHRHPISNLVPSTRTVNGKVLSANIFLNAADVGAAAAEHSHDFSAITNRLHRHNVGEIDGLDLNGQAPAEHSHSEYAAVEHNHPEYDYGNATTSESGLMSAADKAKVNKIRTNGTGLKFLANDGSYKAIAEEGAVIVPDVKSTIGLLHEPTKLNHLFNATLLDPDQAGINRSSYALYILPSDAIDTEAAENISFGDELRIKFAVGTEVLGLWANESCSLPVLGIIGKDKDGEDIKLPDFGDLDCGCECGCEYECGCDCGCGDIYDDLATVASFVKLPSFVIGTPKSIVLNPTLAETIGFNYLPILVMEDINVGEGFSIGGIQIEGDLTIKKGSIILFAYCNFLGSEAIPSRGCLDFGALPMPWKFLDIVTSIEIVKGGEN
jgi:hypothetical protein